MKIATDLQNLILLIMPPLLLPMMIPTSSTLTIYIFTQVVVSPLLYSFIRTPDISIVGTDGPISNNASFGIKAKSDAIDENEDCIPPSSVHANKNDN